MVFNFLFVIHAIKPQKLKKIKKNSFKLFFDIKSTATKTVNIEILSSNSEHID